MPGPLSSSGADSGRNSSPEIDRNGDRDREAHLRQYRQPTGGFIPLQGSTTDLPNIPHWAGEAPAPHLGRRGTIYLPSLLANNASSVSLHRPDFGGIRRASSVVLNKPVLRSHRLIGNSNPRYEWAQYIKTDEELKAIKKKSLRQYYERNNKLAEQYQWADSLLNSSIVPRLLESYNRPVTIPENPPSSSSSNESGSLHIHPSHSNSPKQPRTPLKRSPSFVRKMASDEETPLLNSDNFGEGDSGDDQDRIVKIAIYVNLIANALLLAGKIVVTLMTSSLSVIASLVDSALDFLSTGIVWVTTHLIGRKDQYLYPIGRRKLEPVGVLVFSVVMITSFFQVALEAFQRLIGPDHSIVQLSNASIAIMATTVAIKGACFVWCRLIKSSSVQALAQDALTDVYFNIFSIFFPLVGYFFSLWWLDALGGLLLSIFVIIQWSRTSSSHIRNLTGAAATADERNLILYVCMRFASSIQKVTSVQAYHAGDLLNVEVEILLEESISLRDSHDLGEALQYVIESMPIVDRAFVHIDYSSENPYGHLER